MQSSRSTMNEIICIDIFCKTKPGNKYKYKFKIAASVLTCKMMDQGFNSLGTVDYSQNGQSYLILN